MTAASCETCLFWRMGVHPDTMHPAEEVTSDYGICENLPPMPIATDMGAIRFMQATTHRTRCCRDHVGHEDPDVPDDGEHSSTVLPFSKVA